MLAKIAFGLIVPVLAVLTLLTPAGARAAGLPGIHTYGPFDTLDQANDLARVPRQTGYKVNIPPPRNQRRWIVEIYPKPPGSRPDFHVYGPYGSLAEAYSHAALMFYKGGYPAQVFQELRQGDRYHLKYFINVLPKPVKKTLIFEKKPLIFK
jgi:hypothetical protein